MGLKKLSKAERISLGLQIFQKYPGDHEVSAQHDILYAGADPEVMTENDKEVVEKLGWHEEIEYDCWGFFT